MEYDPPSLCRTRHSAGDGDMKGSTRDFLYDSRGNQIRVGDKVMKDGRVGTVTTLRGESVWVSGMSGSIWARHLIVLQNKTTELAPPQ
jgi:hypothetical protein